MDDINMMKTVVVSRCLAGGRCRYDGKDNLDAEVAELVKAGRAVCVCPEVMGGLPVPRLPAEISGGDGGDVLDGRAKVVDISGADVTAQFVSGAREALKLALGCGAERAILKARSPSCGLGVIYDGSFTGTLKQGDGVTAALFTRNGITVETR